MIRRRVAHFLSEAFLADSPPNEAAVHVWRGLGYEVDLFAPGGGFSVENYGAGVRALPAEYGYRWLGRNLTARRWRQYASFSGTTEDPMALAGVLGWAHRRPVITFADEIKSDAYAGNRSARWKALCRFGMRQSVLTIVNEEERVELQRGYAGLSANARVIIYPGCFRQTPPMGDRQALRAHYALPSNALVLVYSGVMNYGNGGLWIAEALARCPSLWVWGQIRNLDPFTQGLLERLEGHERLALKGELLGWQGTWSSMAAADIGLVVYLQQASQFQRMGVASNRLCMFLSMGVPVIANRQRSFEFIKRYNCGVLIEGPEQMPAAVDRIAARLEPMRSNALDCAREYIRAPQRYAQLRDALAEVYQR